MFLYSMRIGLVFLLVSLSSGALFGQQEVIGDWKTIDDETGEATSVVRIYKKNGGIYGKVISILKEDANPKSVCDKCPQNDDRYGEPILGMEIIRGLKWMDDAYQGGTVLKPDEGKIYKCKIWLEDGDLKVRGYWGLFFRTQTWIKTN